MHQLIDLLRRHLFALMLIILVGGFAILAISQKSHQDSATDVSLVGVKTFNLTDRTHVDESVKYDQVPPVAGKHSPVWAQCDGKVYDAQIPNEQAVHSLEHGAVWITYRSDLDTSSVKKLEKKVAGFNYTLMSPYPDQPDKITLTAWDHQLSVDSADDPRIDLFLKKFRLGEQTPEPGASCQAVSTSM